MSLYPPESHHSPHRPWVPVAVPPPPRPLPWVRWGRVALPIESSPLADVLNNGRVFGAPLLRFEPGWFCMRCSTAGDGRQSREEFEARHRECEVAKP